METLPPSLSDERKAEIYSEGRQAALNYLTPFSCPYLDDVFNDRFRAWCEGFWSVDRGDD